MTAETLGTGQIAWQRRAAGKLTEILLRYPHLPPLSWTVGNAGATLTATVSTLPTEPEIRDAFTAWADVLALTVTPARTDQISTRLMATGRRDGVHLVLTATIYAEDGS
ncbi:hypothetical protein [Streptomyces sp.]|uniref:hypothetical protein n=1 Tax=Streptomyces sp. TaxID=1931 RepID=UPI002F935B3F